MTGNAIFTPPADWAALIIDTLSMMILDIMESYNIELKEKHTPKCVVHLILEMLHKGGSQC
jgi:hypothetical protein